MLYLVTSLVSFTAGVTLCAIYKNSVISALVSERDQLKKSASDFISKL